MEIKPRDLLFVVFISFYIIRYQFLQIFRTLFNIIWKKRFLSRISFFNGFIQPIPLLPINGQNPLSVAKVFVDAPYTITVKQIAFFWGVSHLCTDCWSVEFINQGLCLAERNFFIWQFHCFMLLLNFITSKYSFFRRLFWYTSICRCLASYLSSWHFPHHKYFRSKCCSSISLSSPHACSNCTEGSGWSTRVVSE